MRISCGSADVVSAYLRGLVLSDSRGPRTGWRVRNSEGSMRVDDARKVITDKKEPSDVGCARDASLRSSHLSTEDRMDRIFTAFARTIASWTGQPLAFIFALLLIVLWIICGPIFQFSDTWQLVVNTATTIITFLMVFVIQNAQNRDGAALQAKLDELIRCATGARDRFIGIEHLGESEVEEIRKALEDQAEGDRSARETLDRLLRRR